MGNNQTDDHVLHLLNLFLTKNIPNRVLIDKDLSVLDMELHK